MTRLSSAIVIMASTGLASTARSFPRASVKRGYVKSQYDPTISTAEASG
jgi:hypothetical protein